MFSFDAILRNTAGKIFNNLNHKVYCIIALTVLILSNCYSRVQEIYIHLIPFHKYTEIAFLYSRTQFFYVMEAEFVSCWVDT